MNRPNFYDCQSCPHYDDINGCWKDCRYVCEAGLLNEEGNYDEEE